MSAAERGLDGGDGKGDGGGGGGLEEEEGLRDQGSLDFAVMVAFRGDDTG